MKAPPWLVPTLLSLAWPLVAAVHFGGVAWRMWPFDDWALDLGVMAWALLGAACVISPDDVAYYASLRGQGYSSFTSAEARTLGDDVVIRVVGVLLLLAALAGPAEWVVFRLVRL